ncbi:hypothetical protein CYY_004212 [Polysphondylium violaceum]|uniref:Polyketide cyclase n=1 Tax=Polysphondylium violaceum TaxID=133409 RepID=A0A8J4PVI9_9MYCE|nr:hypothetical protein CYY_004212 [Polysphondylium violaceum]
MSNPVLKEEHMDSIHWPEKYLPGTTDNYCCNEVIVQGLKIQDAWPYLIKAPCWTQYYHNSADIKFDNQDGPYLYDGCKFFFRTFGFPIDAKVTEFLPSDGNGSTARISWHGWNEDPENRLDVIHAWLFQELSGNRLRILTQESQIGKPAIELATKKPNAMINGHQDWLDGIVKAAKEKLKI